MYCLGLMSSGNYVYALCRILERKGYVFEVVSTPCHIAREGCGYCLKFPCEFTDMVIREGAANGLYINEVYRVIPAFNRNKYEKIY